MVQEASNKWLPAIYARLSNEDKELKRNDVSLSINNQIDILKNFVKDKGWPSPKIYSDDDQTGTNFNRKGFQDMYAAAQRGEINVIVIKDTSRFGRNWVQSGHYFTSIEDMGIRFISIQEGLDTADPKCPALKMLPFYFIFNEWHSATTSEKIKAVFAKYAEQGGYIGSIPPYGYERCSNNKQKLIVDPDAAIIVKRIYEMRLQKHSYLKIAKTLNKEGIPSPTVYWANKSGREVKRNGDGNWSNHTVKTIIRNLVYCGDIANNKSSTKNFKSQKRKVTPKSEWLIVKDMHEAIVSREDWETCAKLGEPQENPSRYRSTTQGKIHTFAGLLKCPACGYSITTTGQRGYNCGSYQKKGTTACNSHYISRITLAELVLTDIKKRIKEVLLDENAARKHFHSLKSHSSKTQLGQTKKALAKVSKRLEDIDKLIQSAFEQSVLNNQGTDFFTIYLKKYEEEKNQLLEQSEQLTITLEKQNQTEQDVDTFIQLLKKHANITKLNRTIVVELIDHITVSEITATPREIVIYYNFMGCVEE